MSKGQFLFFTPNRGNEEHLKSELKYALPDLKLSFSRPGFLTFKNSGNDIDLKSLSTMHFAFSRVHGLCLGPVDEEKVTDEIESYLKHYSIHSYNIHNWSRDGKKASSDINSSADFIFDVIEVDRNKIWLGLHLADINSNSAPGGFPQLSLPEDSPSRAYLKIAEIVHSYKLKVSQQDTILDIGCAPGGATQFFLERGNCVIGIDPGEMNEICSKNSNFTHLQSPVQKISKAQIKKKIDWIIMDLNLQAGLSLKEGIRLAKEYPNLKGLVFTVKMPTPDLSERIVEFVSKFYSFKFNHLIYSQVPTHKKEFAIIAYN
ncbi:SAM-dependent methyltransferase [Halobacteriovorax sp. HLS]|uniref:SAM-dependent methyltransferase n=1 Tax=Halobacteriovorax sp. HLS TaxID=2234000 RepID=UPI000FDC4074|nr:SAM-dependent methyltransferase [Halobacteriovorax sp. HLS]